MWVILPSDEYPTLPLNPSEEALDHPPPCVSPQPASILCGGLAAIGSVRRDHLDAVSITAAAAVFLALGAIIDPKLVRVVCGLVLIGWAFYHMRYGHRHRVRFGMRTGLLGLASFLMATAHGAGIMLWPALMPLCFPGGSAPAGSGPVEIALMGIAVHMAAMLIATTFAAVAVYEWAGLEILRRGWINVDLIWTAVLFATGGLLLLI